MTTRETMNANRPQPEDRGKEQTMTTRETMNAIRQTVDRHGWDAVRRHPVLGPALIAIREQSRDYVNKTIDTD